MRLLILLNVLTLFVLVSLTGCDPAMRQPIMEVVKPPSDSLEMDPLEKAQEAMARVNEGRTETYQTAEETGDFSIVFTASENIFKEELGFRKGFWVDLVDIYRQENLGNPEQLEGLDNLQDAFTEKLEDDTLGMFYFTYIGAFDELIVEYLRLSFESPGKSEEELLALFRESVRDEKASVMFP